MRSEFQKSLVILQGAQLRKESSQLTQVINQVVSMIYLVY